MTRQANPEDYLFETSDRTHKDSMRALGCSDAQAQ
jgi:hypothetical protein